MSQNIEKESKKLTFSIGIYSYCDDNIFNMELTEQEFKLLVKVAKKSKELAKLKDRYTMPVLEINNPIGEE